MGSANRQSSGVRRSVNFEMSPEHDKMLKEERDGAVTATKERKKRIILHQSNKSALTDLLLEEIADY